MATGTTGGAAATAENVVVATDRASLIAASPDNNVAYTHARVDGVVRQVQPDTTRSIGPAAALPSVT